MEVVGSVVEPPAVPVDGAGQAADLAAFLDDDDRDPGGGQLPGGGQARDAGADDDDGLRGGRAHAAFSRRSAWTKAARWGGAAVAPRSFLYQALIAAAFFPASEIAPQTRAAWRSVRS